MPHPPQNDPVRPRQLAVQIVETGTGLELTYRPREWASGCFMALWLCGWTVGCVFLAVMVIQRPQVVMFLFGIPFWASWVFVAGLVLRSFLRVERLELDHDGVRFQSSLLGWRWLREIPAEEVREFTVSMSSGSGDDGPAYSLELVTLGKPLAVFSGLAPDEREWLAWRLNQELRQLGLRQEPEIDGRAGQTVESPSDGSWIIDEANVGLMFQQQGKMDGTTVGGLLFINLFWNGIVSVFVCALLGLIPLEQNEGWEWWGLFFFLIPFEVIGLLMFFGLLGAVLEPVRKTSWCFTEEEITYRYTLFGVGRTWSYPAQDIIRVELRLQDLEAGSQPKWGKMSPDHQLLSVSSYALRFVDRDGVEVISWSALTEGEARWIAHQIARAIPRWEFPNTLGSDLDR